MTREPQIVSREVKRAQNGAWCVLEGEQFYPFGVYETAMLASIDERPLAERGFIGWPLLMFVEASA